MTELSSFVRGGNVEYNFEYDTQNRPTKVKVGDQTLSENVYNTTLGDPLYGTLKQIKYGNQQTEEHVYDDFKRLVGVRLNGSTTDSYQYTYGAEGQVRKITDQELGRTVLNEYDVQSRPMRITTVEGDNHIYTGEVAYDEYNNLKTFKE